MTSELEQYTIWNVVVGNIRATSLIDQGTFERAKDIEKGAVSFGVRVTYCGFVERFGRPVLQVETDVPINEEGRPIDGCSTRS